MGQLITRLIIQQQEIEICEMRPLEADLSDFEDLGFEDKKKHDKRSCCHF